MIGALEGLLLVYGLLLMTLITGLVAGAFILAAARGRFLRRPWLGRLILLDCSLLLCVIGLKGASAAWTGWLHRSPSLPPVSVKPAEPLLRPPGTPQGGTADSDRGPLRILVMGESSARGEPYHPWLSVGQIVGWQLEKVFPGRPVQVDMQAEGGATLEEVHRKLAGITYRPDALVLFSGHNEFQGAGPGLAIRLTTSTSNRLNSLRSSWPFERRRFAAWSLKPWTCSEPA